MTTEPRPENPAPSLSRGQDRDQETDHDNESRGGLLHAVHTQVSVSGPLPPPDVLAKYDELVPGAADRIIRMAEEEGFHRHRIESRHLEAVVKDAYLERIERRMGQVFGLMIGLAALIVGAIVAINVGGWPGGVAGSILGGSGVATLVAVFVRGGGSPESDSSRELSEQADS